MREFRHLGSLAALLLSLIPAACATPPQTRALRENPPDLPRHVELSEVPFFPQEAYQCGPAALAGILTHRGIQTDAQQLVQAVYVPARKGSLQVEMLAAPREHALLSLALEPSLQALLTEVAAGNPVLVLQNLGLSWVPRWHYAVAIGYDLDARTLILRSGTQARRVTDFSVFERSWARSERWAMLVVPPDRVPPSIGLIAYTQAAHALERTGHTEAARQAYASARARWETQLLPLLGLGNTAYALHDYAASEAAFRQAVTEHPRVPQAWNNLAYALAAQDCVERSREAAQCALALAPDNDNIAETLAEMQLKPARPGAEPCSVLNCPVPLSGDPNACSVSAGGTP